MVFSKVLTERALDENCDEKKCGEQWTWENKGGKLPKPPILRLWINWISTNLNDFGQPYSKYCSQVPMMRLNHSAQTFLAKRRPAIIVSQKLFASAQNVDWQFRLYTILVRRYFSLGNYIIITQLVNDYLSSEGLPYQLNLWKVDRLWLLIRSVCFR